MIGLGTTEARTRAAELRRGATKPERLLWSLLRRHRSGLHFRRQHAAGEFILDFYCARARLCVEIDGSTHDFTAERDRARDQWLERSLGIMTMRIPARLVLDDPDRVAAHIGEVAWRRAGWSPSPADAGCSP